jgi:hypothetical protein
MPSPETVVTPTSAGKCRLATLGAGVHRRTVVTLSGDLAERKALAEFNRQREKTPGACQRTLLTRFISNLCHFPCERYVGHAVA